MITYREVWRGTGTHFLISVSNEKQEVEFMMFILILMLIWGLKSNSSTGVGYPR